MKYLPFLIFAALIFLLCFLGDKGIAALCRFARERSTVRLPLKYPVLAVLTLSAAIFCTAVVWQTHSTLMTGAGVVLLGVFAYIVYVYQGTKIIYDQDTFTFIAGKEKKRFRYEDIQYQRVAIQRGGCCLVLVVGKDEIVFYSNMQGFYPFLDYAFLRWCDSCGLDPKGQDWHNPDDYRWFPDDEDAEPGDEPEKE